MTTAKANGTLAVTGRIRLVAACPVGVLGEYDTLAEAMAGDRAYDRRRLPNQPHAWYEVELALPNGVSREQWAHARLIDGELIVDPASLLPAVFCA